MMKISGGDNQKECSALAKRKGSFVPFALYLRGMEGLRERLGKEESGESEAHTGR
jgi:hypothetical protein